MSVEPTVFPGRLVVADEGGQYVHLDMYRTHGPAHLRIGVTRDVLRVYAQKLLEAANRMGTPNADEARTGDEATGTG